jgi:hypothetical protein
MAGLKGGEGDEMGFQTRFMFVEQRMEDLKMKREQV